MLDFPNLKYERYSLGYYSLLVKAIHILLVVYPTKNDQIPESELLMQTTFTAVIGSKANATTKAYDSLARFNQGMILLRKVISYY